MGNKILVNDSSSDELVPYIAQTISTWLIYNSHVGGKIGVQENMIDYPVKAYLVRHQKKWKIATFEENHPYLSYRRIDFYLQYMGVNHYFEFKQAKKETKGESEFQRVYNDLIRLAICKKKNPKDRCFFLMFGEAVAYKTFFVEGKNDNMQYSDFFVFLQNAQNTEKYFFPKNKTFTDDSSSESCNVLYDNFKGEYEKNIKTVGETIDCIVPDELYTKLIWTNYCDNNDGMSDPVVLGVWELMMEPSNAAVEFVEPKREGIQQFLDTSTGLTNISK